MTRLEMAQQILDLEARRDQQGRLLVYQIPPGDGGGSFEVAGINDRYHPAMALRLMTLIQEGHHRDAEALARGYIAEVTDVAAGWTRSAPVEFFLRDCIFNRGATGAARILQSAVGVEIDGIVGPKTRRSLDGLLAAYGPGGVLQALRRARETHERLVVGRDERSKFWRGLVNRWDKVLAMSLSLVEVEDSPHDLDGAYEYRKELGVIMDTMGIQDQLRLASYRAIRDAFGSIKQYVLIEIAAQERAFKSGEGPEKLKAAVESIVTRLMGPAVDASPWYVRLVLRKAVAWILSFFVGRIQSQLDSKNWLEVAEAQCGSLDAWLDANFSWWPTEAELRALTGR
jgi:hypothetical protein